MGKYNRVVQTGFDIAIGEGVTNEEMESLCDAIRETIDNFYGIDGKAQNIMCVNGIYGFEDMTEIYKQGDPDLNKLN